MRRLKDSSCIFTSGLGQSQKKEPTRKVGRVAKQDFTSIKYGYNEGRADLGDKSFPIPQIHVFKGFLNIPRKNIIDALIKVRDLNGRMQTLFVAYNETTHRIYMSYDQLVYYHKKDIQLMINMVKSNEGSQPFDSWDFNEYSLLALYGYKVGKNGLSTPEREKLLRFIIDNKVLKCFEIISHIQGCIQLRLGRDDMDFSEAINDWEHDIHFVRDYAKNSGNLKYVSQNPYENLPILEDEELPFS